jgi:hypothetical protein
MSGMIYNDNNFYKYKVILLKLINSTLQCNPEMKSACVLMCPWKWSYGRNMWERNNNIKIIRDILKVLLLWIQVLSSENKLVYRSVYVETT